MVAVGWGGLVASVGLMAAGGRELAVRLLVAAAFFLLGGFLAGVRSSQRRALHAVASALCALVIFAVWVGLASAIAPFVDPDAPELLAGGAGRTGFVVLWSMAFAALGGMLAGSWLRPGHRGKARKYGTGGGAS